MVLGYAESVAHHLSRAGHMLHVGSQVAINCQCMGGTEIFPIISSPTPKAYLGSLIERFEVCHVVPSLVKIP
ncbi:hypothetical protein B296_00032711 [Ensete ventricosum]|uniref:Uncharacterized protein n=1 Tax=Ensete ventricosum TaxID=4639 RepID=A0A426YBS4_ENSVE|nr:hypothetical protein B296_00032711 [Ensete ventricosum]